MTTGPSGTTYVTLPGGDVTIPVPGDADGNTSGYTLVLPNGDVLTHSADGTTSVQLASTGQSQNWDASGHYTGTTSNDADGGANPTLQHDVYVPMAGGGYRVDHPDGSSDIHWPNGAIVHVNPDGVTWTQKAGPRP